MEDILYIVVYRINSNYRWQAMSEGEMTSRRLALNLIECKRAAGCRDWQFAIVEGHIVNPDQMAEAEAALGVF